jgi:hypothetical protein
VAKLTAKKRNALPESTFAGPDRSYPIPDASHARNALARAAQHASPELQSTIKAKVRRKFPAIHVEGEAPKSRGDRASRSRKG